MSTRSSIYYDDYLHLYEETCEETCHETYELIIHDNMPKNEMTGETIIHKESLINLSWAILEKFKELTQSQLEKTIHQLMEELKKPRFVVEEPQK